MRKITKPTTSHRVSKLQSFLTQELGDIIKPLIENQKGLITISRVEISPDLKNAKVWISIFGGNDKKILETLQKHSYTMNRELFKIMATKIVPNLRFALDEAPRYAQHIDEIIKEIHSEQ